MRYRANKKIDKSSTISIRLSPELKSKVMSNANEMGISSNEYIRRALCDKIESGEFSKSDRVFDILDNPDYIAKLKEKLGQL